MVELVDDAQECECRERQESTSGHAKRVVKGFGASQFVENNCNIKNGAQSGI